MICVGVVSVYHNIMTDMLPTYSNDIMKSLLAGLYSDFTVIIGDKVYRVHKFVLADYSGFFNGLFRTQPDQASVEFDSEHLLAQDITIWEHLVAVWYKNKDYIQVQHDGFDYQRVLGNYTAVCQYLSTPIPDIQYNENNYFMPFRHEVTYHAKTDTIEITCNLQPIQPTPLVWNKVAVTTEDGREDSIRRKPKPGTVKAMACLNRLVEENTGGRCVNPIKTLAVYRDKEHTRLAVLINGHRASISSSNRDLDNWIRFQKHVNDAIYLSIPHMVEAKPEKRR